MADYIYRFGTLDDVEGITDMMASCWLVKMSEAWGNYFTVDEPGIRQFMIKFIADKNAVLLVTTPEGYVVGGMGLMITRYFWAKEDVMTEHGIFVRPEHRKSQIAVNLVKWAKHLAAEHKMPLIVAQISRLEPERVSRFYTKICGLTPIGGYFTYVP